MCRSTIEVMPKRDPRAYRLLAGERPAAGVRRIALGRAERAGERLREAERAADPSECIHAARKDLKKLRAVARLVRHELGEDLYRAENARYRDAGRLLSGPRDAEVKLETLEGLCGRSGELGPGIDEWLAALSDERDRAVEEVRRGAIAAGRASATTPLGRAIAAVEPAPQRIGAWPLRTDSWQLVGPGVDRAYRRGRREMSRADADPSGPAMHRWRKRAKDLWYQLRILRDATPGSLSDSLGLADELAEALGDHHDLTLLRDDLLRRELPAIRRPTVVAAIEARQDELAAEAFDLGESLYARRPKPFRRKLRRGWKDWRKG
jgi:CHAD domain-containing protein